MIIEIEEDMDIKPSAFTYANRHDGHEREEEEEEGERTSTRK